MNASKEVKSVIVTSDLTIREAMGRLCANSKQILIVVKGPRLVGTLCDGDIRRHLLDGGALEDSIAAAANLHPKYLFETERGRAESFIWERRINAVPIVDEDMTLVDVVFLHDTIRLDEVSIRELRPADLAMVEEFFDQMAGDTRAMFNRNDANRIRVIEHLSRRSDDNEVHFAAVVPENGGQEKMVGYVFLWDAHLKTPWLGIAVREDWKGRHLGRMLLRFLDEYARGKGYGGLMLTSVPANVRAHALYSRMGFDYFGTYPDGEFLYIKRYAN